MHRWQHWLGLGMLLLNSAVHADVQAFRSGSLQQILTAHHGKPFILSYWSLSCTHCATEMTTFAQLQQRYPHLPIILVSTDSPEDIPELLQIVAQQGLTNTEQWVFADSSVEKLRYAIDRHWYGELPRTYLYAANHQVTAISGAIPIEKLEAWIQQHLP